MVNYLEKLLTAKTHSFIRVVLNSLLPWMYSKTVTKKKIKFYNFLIQEVAREGITPPPSPFPLIFGMDLKRFSTKTQKSNLYQ